MNSFIVIISGTSGSGKTSVVSRCAKALAAAPLVFDDYIDRATVLQELMEWSRRGNLLADWTVPNLSDALYGLASKNKLVLVEEPFGRGRRELSAIADLNIHLHLPLELAFARKMLRDGSALEKDLSGDAAWTFVRRFSQFYLDGLHHLFLEADRMACESADLCIDARRPIQKVTADATEIIQMKVTPWLF